jgi:hypothetical protein
MIDVDMQVVASVVKSVNNPLQKIPFGVTAAFIVAVIFRNIKQSTELIMCCLAFWVGEIYQNTIMNHLRAAKVRVGMDKHFTKRLIYFLPRQASRE